MLVVQSKDAREFSEDEVYALEVVAMVLAEMTELGAFVGEGAALSALHQQPVLFRGSVGQEGVAEGQVYLHEPRVVVTNPVADDPKIELIRLQEAVNKLRMSVDDMLSLADTGDKEQREVLQAYRMFANSRSWIQPHGRGHRQRSVSRSRGRERADRRADPDVAGTRCLSARAIT